MGARKWRVMARRPAIELSKDERGELERRAREATAPWREVQRARIVLYAVDGQSDREIAERLDCTERKVERKLNLIRLTWKENAPP